MATEWISRNAVFAALDMRAVLAHYQIKHQTNDGRGLSFRIHCPFHEDERPSCSINSKQKLFNCFGCEAQGNVLDFIAAMEGLDAQSEFRAVLETAIDIIGYNPSPPRNGRRNNLNDAHSGGRGRKAQNPQSDTHGANGGVAGDSTNEVSDTRVSQTTDDNQSFKDPTPKERPSSNSQTNGKMRCKEASSNGARDNVPPNKIRDNVPPNKILQAPAFPLKLERQHMFLEQRGFGQDLLDEFGIGYETRSNALMAGRICFPIHNAKGGLVAYAGRWAGFETNAEGEFIDGKDRVQERYKLPKGFAKQLELYNLHRVLNQFPKPKQRRKLHLVVVEGFWSVLRLHSLTRSKKDSIKENGKGKEIRKKQPKEKPITEFPVVALMGRTISKQQIQLLRKYGFQNIVLMLDGDDEGKKATRAILPKLAEHFFVKDAYLPDGTKPDDVDIKFLKKIIQNPKPTSKGKKRWKKNTKQNHPD